MFLNRCTEHVKANRRFYTSSKQLLTKTSYSQRCFSDHTGRKKPQNCGDANWWQTEYDQKHQIIKTSNFIFKDHIFSYNAGTLRRIKYSDQPESASYFTQCRWETCKNLFRSILAERWIPKQAETGSSGALTFTQIGTLKRGTETYHQYFTFSQDKAGTKVKMSSFAMAVSEDKKETSARDHENYFFFTDLLSS